MDLLRRAATRALPASLLHDVRYIGFPGKSGDGLPVAEGINILRSHYAPKATVGFFPQQPLPGHRRGAIAYKLCRLLGYGISGNAARRHDAVFKYTRETFSEPLAAGNGRVINGACTDVSKRASNAAFEKAFGYALGVDPTTYRGTIVVKSTLNSTHDGTLVDGPIPPAEVRETEAYQKAIDNTVPGEGRVLDHRVPIHGEQIPLVYLKYRPVAERFDNKSTAATVARADEVFTRAETENLLRFAQHMGLDFGELDVLRHNADDRLYVVDANPTPWGPPIGLSLRERTQALMQMEASFSALLRRYASQ